MRLSGVSSSSSEDDEESSERDARGTSGSDEESSEDSVYFGFGLARFFGGGFGFRFWMGSSEELDFEELESNRGRARLLVYSSDLLVYSSD